jgi:stress-induced morphogen
MPISALKLQAILEHNFPNAQIKITDLAGDQDHYSLEIKCASFNNLTLIKQHKLVKDALSEVLKKELHAITVKTSGV